MTFNKGINMNFGFFCIKILCSNYDIAWKQNPDNASIFPESGLGLFFKLAALCGSFRHNVRNHLNSFLSLGNFNSILGSKELNERKI